MKSFFAKLETGEQFVDMRESPVCPDGFIEMQYERPEGDYIAAIDGTWKLSHDQILESLKQERNRHRQQGLTYQGHQLEATEVDQSNIIAIITGYSQGIRAEDAAVYWKVAPNQYLTLTGKSEAVALAAAMDTYVQNLFNIEAKLGQEVTTMTTKQLKAFDAKLRFQEELDQIT